MNKSPSSHSEKSIQILLIVLSVIAVAVTLFVFAGKKEGFHMDEMFSYELANSEYSPWVDPRQPEGRLAKFVHNEIDGDSFKETISNILTEANDVLKNGKSSKMLSYKADYYAEPVWITGQQFTDYISVNSTDDFNIASVYFNTINDSHPPFSFMMLHIVFSFFKNNYSAFVGCIPGILFLLGTMLLMSTCTKYYFNDLLQDNESRLFSVIVSILPIIVYGFSHGAISTAMLIRMYAPLTFFCFAWFTIVLKKWVTNSFNVKNKLLICVTVLGFLTQYYFLIYCFAGFCVAAILLLKNRRTSEFFAFLRSMVISAVIGLALYPVVIKNMLFDRRSSDVMFYLNILDLSGIYVRSKAFFEIIADNVCGNSLLFIILISCALILFIAYSIKKHVKADRFLLLTLPSVFFFIIVMLISPFLTGRYVMPLYVFCSFMISVFIIRLLYTLKGCFKNRTLFCIPAFLLIVLIIVNAGVSVASYDNENLYIGYNEQKKIAKENKDTSCICVSDDLGYYEHLTEFAQYDKTLIVSHGELENRTDTLSISELDKVIVMILRNGDYESVEKVLNSYDLYCEDCLLENGIYGDSIYLFKK